VFGEKSTIAKVTRPNFSGVLERERLFQLLDAGFRRRLIWVAGPPGSGKTALVSSYLKERSLPHLWYRLDERDEDLSAFFHYIRLAANNAAPGEWPSQPSLSAFPLRSLSAFARQFFEALCARRPPPFVLAFDDYQELGAKWTIRSIFNKALSEIPEGVCCVFISRSEPEAEFARIASYGHMQYIGWDELRFTLDETKQLARGHDCAGMNDTRIERLFLKTGGWAAGLVMALEAARDGNVSDAFPEKLSNHSLFDYFTAEIFDRLDPTVRSFLLSTAFLPEVNGPTAERLTETCGRARSILSELHRNNFFISNSESESGIYRFHPLFQDFLRAYAGRVLETETLNHVRTGAAQIMESEGMVEEAADLYIELGDWKNALRLLLTHARTCLIHGKAESLERRLAGLPSAALESTPYVSYWRGMCRLSEDPGGSRSYFENAFRRFNEAGDAFGALLAWSGAVETLILELGDMRRMDPWVQWLDQQPSDSPVFSSQEIHMVVARSMLGVLALRRSDHPRAEYWVAEAEALLDSGLEMNSRVLLAARLYYYYSLMEENSRTDQIFKRLEPLIDPDRLQILPLLWWRFLELHHSRYTAWQKKESCEIYFENVRQAMALTKDLGFRTFDRFNPSFGAHAALVVRDFKTFDEMVGALRESLDDSNILGHILYQVYIGLKFIYQGDYASAREQGNIALRLAENMGSPLYEYRGHILLFHSYIGLEAPEAAREHFSHIRRIAESIPNLRHDAILKLTESCLLFKTGEILQGARLLKAGLKEAKRHNTIHSTFWFPSVLTELCANALDRGIEVTYVQDIIRRTRLMPQSSETVSEKWPFAIKIHSLGGFEIERDGKPLDFAGRVPQKPLALLKTIIAFGRPEVSMEQIADSIWPDADGDAAHSAFSTTLGRLRKLLGCDEAVRVRHGKVSLDPQYCWVDVRRFLHVLEELDAVYHRCELTNNTKRDLTSESFLQDRLIRLTEGALALYKGPFLGDESLNAQGLVMRERLRSRNVQLILSSGKYLERAGQWRRAADLYLSGLETDGLVEELYGQLMVCYRQMGLRADAAAVFKRCEKVLMEALGIEPSDHTRQIYLSLFKK